MDEVLVKINASVLSRFIYIIFCTFPLCFPTKDRTLWFAKACSCFLFCSSYQKFDLQFGGEGDGEIHSDQVVLIVSDFVWVVEC